MENLTQPLMDEQVETHAPVLFRPRRLAHANIFVSDVARSVEFYNHVCGLEVVARDPRNSAAFLSNGSSHHDVACLANAGQPVTGPDGHVQVPRGRGKLPGLNHFGWEMENEVELIAAYRRACAAGLKIHRVSDHTLSRSVYVFDPDGNLHELYSDSIKDWRGLYNSPRPLSGYTTGWTPHEKAASAARNYEPNPEFRVVLTAIFHSVRLERATVIARNFSRMRDFYVTVLGLAPLHESLDPPVTYFAGQVGKLDITLVACRPDEPHGLHHCSFEIRDEIDLIEGEKRYNKKIGPVELSLDLPTKRSTFVRSPDSLLVEFFSSRKLEFCDMNIVEEIIRGYVP